MLSARDRVSTKSHKRTEALALPKADIYCPMCFLDSLYLFPAPLTTNEDAQPSRLGESYFQSSCFPNADGDKLAYQGIDRGTKWCRRVERRRIGGESRRKPAANARAHA